MNRMQQLAKEGLVERFLARMGMLDGRTVNSELGGAMVLENPTEELVEGAGRGRMPSLFAMGPRKGKKKLKRKEENYLYSTRRFPNNTANDTIGSGPITAADYEFFSMGVGDQGSAAGYFSLQQLTALQTNMLRGGKIPTGRGFALYELAVSFNARAKPDDIAQLMDTMELRYEKNDDLIIHHGPLRLWPGGTGLSGFAAAATTASTTTINTQGGSSGLPSLGSVRRFRNPRLINANESVKYVLNAAARTPNNNGLVALSDFVEVCIWLFGFHFTLVSE